MGVEQPTLKRVAIEDSSFGNWILTMDFLFVRYQMKSIERLKIFIKLSDVVDCN